MKNSTGENVLYALASLLVVSVFFYPTYLLESGADSRFDILNDNELRETFDYVIPVLSSFLLFVKIALQRGTPKGLSIFVNAFAAVRLAKWMCCMFDMDESWIDRHLAVTLFIIMIIALSCLYDLLRSPPVKNENAPRCSPSVLVKIIGVEEKNVTD